MGDRMAELAAQTTRPPKGRVHLHLFVARRGLHRVAVSEEGEVLGGVPARWSPTPKTVLDIATEWRVSTKPSSVCKTPGRCVLADVVTG